ncbi:hypothetical protein [Campylobacter sp.]|uniref:hypothetical protein n=1 Tax=Campylobacter sp. TaxID=205 RepID=UPI002AA779E4|nr:hypothetical protein [Campylobacter sp.]MCI7447360.1 hypothetical protein [Campylobacter sp.]
MNEILNEIASSFVSLTPRNDGENSRIPSIRDPRVKPEDDIVGNSRFICDEILQSSWWMT